MASVEWGEYRIDDLFNIYTGRDVIIGKTSPGEIPLISHQNTENGVTRRIEHISNRRIFHYEETISLADRGVFYATTQNEDFHIGTRVKALVFKDGKKSENVRLFFSSAINKLQILFTDYSSNATDKLPKYKIQLPVLNGQIDYNFMESFIEELEAERIEELSVVNDLISKNIEFKPFCYDVIFDKIVQGRRLKKDDQIAGDIPFVMAGVTNTGVVGYISNPVASFPKNSITIDIFGNAFYRNYDFGAGDDTGVYWSEKSDYSKEIMLFLTCSMGKSIENKFSYGKKLRSSQSFKFKMQLPVKNEQPDYELMSTLISAIQKLVIADVVKFSDEKIKATKQVVG